MSPETLIMVVVLVVLFFCCLICCTDNICDNDTITIDPEVDNPVIEL